MKKRYITFFDKERELMCDLPWGDDSLVVVLATDTHRLERARFQFAERQARMLLAKERNREDQAKTLREISSMVIGIRPTSIPPKPLAPAPVAEPTANRVSSLRFAHLLHAKQLSKGKI